MNVLAERFQLEGYIFGNFDENGELEEDGWDRELLALLTGTECPTSTSMPVYLQAIADKPQQQIHVDDFSEFDLPAPQVQESISNKSLPEHLKRFQGPLGSIKFTEFHISTKKPTKTIPFHPPSPPIPILPTHPDDNSEQADQGDATEDIDSEDLESDSPKRIRIAKDQRDTWLELKVKHVEVKPDRTKILIGPEIYDDPVISGSLPLMSEQYPIEPRTLVELHNWEESILWDDETEASEEELSPQLDIVKPRYIDQELLHVNLDWDDDSIIWDDTKPNTYIPTPRLYVDPQLFGISFAPIVKRKDALKTPLSLNYDQHCLESLIPIRQRLFTSSALIQHSPWSFQHKLVPWQMTDAMCREFHRPNYKIQAKKIKVKFVQPKEIRPEEQVQGRASTQWSLSDLSGMENLVMLIEYTEQHPPIIQNVGMASKLRNFYSQQNDEDIALNLCENAIGENVSLAPEDPSPFLGKIKPGERMYGIENKLYKAAMFESSCVAGPEWTDLLLSKTPQGDWLVRRVSRLFVVGQTLPLQKVPSPSSKTSMNYSRDRLKHFITESLRRDPKILLQDVKNIFPNETDASIRNVLKDYCNFQRKSSQAWLMNPKVELQAESILWALATPEAVCLNESSHAALLRLKDMGIVRFTNPYSLSEAFDALDSDPKSKEILKQIESEIQLMPWNTTTTFCDVMHGRLKLSVAGDNDLNNQFAFAKTRTDARAIKALVEEKNRRLADGSDLRKVKLNHARAFLRLSGEPEESFLRLRRWALIDKMRDKATEMAASGNKDPLVLKYARPTIDNSNVRQQEFDARAQIVFDRMVAYCRGETLHTESDVAFEQELEDLFDEVAPANLDDEMGNLSESESAKSPRVVPGKKRKKPGPPSNSKRMRMTCSADEEQELESLIAKGQDQPMGKVVGRVDKRKQVTFAKPDQEIVRKICTFIGKDNTVTRTVEYIRDPAQVLYYKKKKRNLEQKRSNIETVGEELAVTTKQDDFFSTFVHYSEKNIEYLRAFFTITKPKQISNKDLKRKASQLGTTTEATLTASERAWLTQCLFISLVEMESCSEDNAYFETPSIRCGKHVPKYRSYEWRRDGWRRLDIHLAFVLSQLQVPIVAWTCQHRDQPNGRICGERPHQSENAISNSEFRKSLLALAKHLDLCLAQGSFLDTPTLRNLLNVA